MPKLSLDRQILSKFLPNHQAIVAFERVLEDVGTTLPSTIEEANANAVTAIAAAQSALSSLAEIAGALDMLLAAPARVDAIEPDDTSPRLQVGTLAAQNSDAVEITGGRIGLDAGSVAAPSFYLAGEDTTGLYRIGANSWGLSIAGVNLVTFSGAAAAYTQNVSTTKQLVSTVAVGTAPLVVTSTTLVANLHAAVADSLGTATVYPANATDLATVIALANAIKAANTSKGV